jgi:NAD(P)-dependent dehydrogenase (short-subunit alcohol dehydrogenase family)
MRLADRVCVVTGGGSGIGRAVAELFAREGARLVVADIDEAAARSAADEARALGAGAQALRVDVAEASDVARMVETAVQAFGRLDVLVNNAGYGLPGTVLDTNEEEWDRLMAVNVKGVFLACRRAIPVMRDQGGGVIVNMASTASSVGLRNRAAYVASKGAVAALTRALALDHVGDNIRVNCVAPGTVETPYFDPIYAASNDPAALREAMAARQAMNRFGRPEEIAPAVLYLACDESSFATGTMLTVDGGMTAQ